MKRVLFLLALAVCVVVLTSFNTVAAGEKVLLCHHNPDLDDDPPIEWFVIEVAAPAVDAHLAHGDYLIVGPATVGAACPQ